MYNYRSLQKFIPRIQGPKIPILPSAAADAPEVRKRKAATTATDRLSSYGAADFRRRSKRRKRGGSSSSGNVNRAQQDRESAKGEKPSIDLRPTKIK